MFNENLYVQYDVYDSGACEKAPLKTEMVSTVLRTESNGLGHTEHYNNIEYRVFTLSAPTTRLNSCGFASSG